jgi:hypothetical protein
MGSSVHRWRLLKRALLLKQRLVVLQLLRQNCTARSLNTAIINSPPPPRLQICEREKSLSEAKQRRSERNAN